MEFTSPHLYILKSSNGTFKIGRSKHPEKRLSELQTGNPNKLELLLVLENMGFLEFSLHNKLSRHRLKGEWFSASGLAELPIWIYEKLDLDKLNK